jgi:hypothetical protein
MFLGVAEKRGDMLLPLIRWSLYHECGYIVYRDVDQPPLKQRASVIGLIIGSSLSSGITTFSLLSNRSRLLRFPAPILIGLATPFVAGYFYYKTIGVYRSRQREAQADRFANEKLCKIGDFEALHITLLISLKVLMKAKTIEAMRSHASIHTQVIMIVQN